jgi:hypothetical protein
MTNTALITAFAATVVACIWTLVVQYLVDILPLNARARISPELEFMAWGAGLFFIFAATAGGQ